MEEDTGCYSELDLEEFKDGLLDNVHSALHTVCVTVDKNALMLDSSILDKLSEELKKHIKQRIELPNYRRRLDEMKRYLAVYDLRKSDMRWDDVVKKIEPHKNFSENVRRAYQLDFNKAVNLISNAEKADFPGKY